MGVDAADFDGDGDEDLFMTHLRQETNTLYINDGKGWFEDRTVSMGLANPSFAHTGFGTAWIDYDNDGWLDLLVVNGAVTRVEEQLERGEPHPLRQPNQLFRNTGNGRYREVSRGVILGDQTGFLKLMFHLETRKILGVAIIGDGAADRVAWPSCARRCEDESAPAIGERRNRVGRQHASAMA